MTAAIDALRADPLTSHIPVELILSPNRTRGVAPAAWRLWVIHTMEGPERSTTAEDVGRWWFSLPTTRGATQFGVDNNSFAQYVPDTDIAWHAPGANHDGYGVEHAGRADQTDAQWADPYSIAEIDLSARLFVVVGHRLHGIPLRRLTIAQVADGVTRGVCGHHDVSLAFARSDHWDPGKAFPWDLWTNLVARYLNQGAPTVPTVTGNVDLLTGAPGAVRAAGWAAYPDTPADAVSIDIEIPTLGLAWRIPTGAKRRKANPHRPDVAAVRPYPADSVGFDLTVTGIPTGTHRVTVRFAGVEARTGDVTVGPVLPLPPAAGAHPNRDAILGALSEAHDHVDAGAAGAHAAIDRAGGLT